MAKQKKTVKSYQEPASKPTYIKETPCSYMRKSPSWAFHLCDEFHPRWSLNCYPSLYNDVLKKLQSYEGMTWGEIQSSSGGKTHGTNSHFEKMSELCKEARKRAEELHIYEDYIFSLRLDGKKRLFGLIEDGVFLVIWYDPNHEIYPSEK